MIDGAKVQADALHRPEVTFHAGQGLIGRHDLASAHLGGPRGGADYVDSVQVRFGVDRWLVAGEGERVVGDGQGVALDQLVLADDLADPDPDLPGAK